MLKWNIWQNSHRWTEGELVRVDDKDEKVVYGSFDAHEDSVNWTLNFPSDAPETGVSESVEEAKMEVERKMMCYPLETGKPAIGRYNDEPHGYGETMSVRKFCACVKQGGFTDNDGHGRPICNGKLDAQCAIWPSTLAAIPEDATHIQWYNK